MESLLIASVYWTFLCESELVSYQKLNENQEKYLHLHKAWHELGASHTSCLIEQLVA